MKDIEAIQRFIKAFDSNLPDLTNDAFWEKLHTGTEWMVKKFPDSPFTEVAEEYERALFLIACIRDEIIKEGGRHIDKIR